MYIALIFITLTFGFILLNVLNNKKISLISLICFSVMILYYISYHLNNIYYIELKNKVDNIDDQLYENSETITKEINQLKRAVGNLEKKFDKVLEAIAALDKKIDAGEKISASKTVTAQPNAKVTPQSTSAKPEDTNIKK